VVEREAKMMLFLHQSAGKNGHVPIDEEIVVDVDEDDVVT